MFMGSINQDIKRSKKMSEMIKAFPDAEKALEIASDSKKSTLLAILCIATVTRCFFSPQNASDLKDLISVLEVYLRQKNMFGLWGQSPEIANGPPVESDNISTERTNVSSLVKTASSISFDVTDDDDDE
jgi:hypothetical protein